MTKSVLEHTKESPKKRSLPNSPQESLSSKRFHPDDPYKEFDRDVVLERSVCMELIIKLAAKSEIPRVSTRQQLPLKNNPEALRILNSEHVIREYSRENDKAVVRRLQQVIPSASPKDLREEIRAYYKSFSVRSRIQRNRIKGTRDPDVDEILEKIKAKRDFKRTVLAPEAGSHVHKVLAKVEALPWHVRDESVIDDNFKVLLEIMRIRIAKGMLRTALLQCHSLLEDEYKKKEESDSLANLWVVYVLTIELTSKALVLKGLEPKIAKLLKQAGDEIFERATACPRSGNKESMTLVLLSLLWLEYGEENKRIEFATRSIEACREGLERSSTFPLPPKSTIPQYLKELSGVSLPWAEKEDPVTPEELFSSFERVWKLPASCEKGANGYYWGTLQRSRIEMAITYLESVEAQQRRRKYEGRVCINCSTSLEGAESNFERCKKCLFQQKSPGSGVKAASNVADI